MLCLLHFQLDSCWKMLEIHGNTMTKRDKAWSVQDWPLSFIKVQTTFCLCSQHFTVKLWLPQMLPNNGYGCQTLSNNAYGCQIMPSLCKCSWVQRSNYYNVLALQVGKQKSRLKILSPIFSHLLHIVYICIHDISWYYMILHDYTWSASKTSKPGSDLVLILISFRDGFRGSFVRTVLAFVATCIS